MKKHLGTVLDERFFENDYMIGNSEQLEFVRSPFYDLARMEKMNADGASNLIDQVNMKL